MKIPWIFLALAAGTINPALANDEIDPATIRQWVEQGRILPIDTILSSPAIRGRILDAEVEWEDDHLVYEVKLLRGDGHRCKVYLDAETGTPLILERRHECGNPRERRPDPDSLPHHHRDHPPHPEFEPQQGEYE
ncbi:PepSY domain-containing protein [Oceanobacter mangrovi]|uniref:PepSY domain-containing protein n=1 Tax=Oceanobacter mangrovi TaxID=2862510 RepID=UPI001C8D78B5|nr:PepSY domain-containing protein [Oceanobacter mangrovi]